MRTLVLNTKKADDFCIKLGTLKADMLALEFSLRLFLWEDERIYGGSSDEMERMIDFKEGDIVIENAFTNYDTFSKLVEKYNKHLLVSTSELKIDNTLCLVRDALAHGRVASNNPNEPMNLLKFSHQKNGKVRVIFNAVLTVKWFESQIKRFLDATKKVEEAIKRIQNNEL